MIAYAWSLIYYTHGSINVCLRTKAEDPSEGSPVRASRKGRSDVLWRTIRFGLGIDTSAGISHLNSTFTLKDKLSLRAKFC